MTEGLPSTIRTRASRLVNLLDFADPGVPERLDSLELEPPDEPQYVLRMPISVDGRRLYIPNDLAWVCPALAAAICHQTEIGASHPCVYVTVRHGPVTTRTDDEWHVDGFSTRVPHVPEQNYVWSDRVGTEYVRLATEFPPDFDPLVHNVNPFLAATVEPSDVRSCEERVLYCLDPYLLHRRPVIRDDRPRTFVRISFVPIEINDVRNTANPLLPRTYTRDGVAHRNSLLHYPVQPAPLPAERHRAPTHPGALLREDVLPALQVTRSEFADLLGVATDEIVPVLDEAAPVTADLALRLGRVCGNGAEVWVRMQAARDLWSAELLDKSQ